MVNKKIVLNLVLFLISSIFLIGFAFAISGESLPSIFITFPTSDGLWFNHPSELNVTYTLSGNVIDTCWSSVNGVNTTIAYGNNCKGSGKILYFTPIQGQNLIGLYANDSSTPNNVQESTINLYYDSIDPVVTLIKPVDSSYTNNPNVLINFTVTDNVATTLDCELYRSNDYYGYSSLGSFSVANGSEVIATEVGEPEGTNDYYVECTDTADNYDSSGENTLFIDTHAPYLVQINSPTNNSYFKTSSVSFNFYAYDNLDSTLSCVRNVDGSTDTISVSSSYSDTLSLGEGIHTINSINCSDDSGNSNTTINPITYTVDTINPSLVLNGPANNAYLNDASVIYNFTVNDTNLANCTIYRNNIFLASGGWSGGTILGDPFTLLNSITSDGVYTWSVTCYDLATNSNVSETRNFTVDTTAPSLVQINSPTNNSYWNTLGVSFNFYAYDNIDSTLTCTRDVDGSTDIIYVSSSYSDTLSLGEGIHTINYVNCSDEAGNTNTTIDVITYTVDTINPSLVLSSPVNYANFSTATITYNFTTNDTNLANCSVYVTGNTASDIISNWFVGSTLTNNAEKVFSSSAGVVEGWNNWTVSCRDLANNRNLSVTRYFLVDRIAPSLTYDTSATYATGSNVSASNIYVKLISSDTNYLSNHTFKLYNASGSNLLTNDTNSTIKSINWTGLAEGIYYYNVSATDFLNNINSSATYKITLDTTAPTLLDFTSVTTDRTSVSFTINITDSLSGMGTACLIDGSNSSVTGIGTNQNVSISGLSCGSSYVSVVNCSDLAGNVNSTSLSYSTSACESSSSGGGGSYTTTTSESLVLGYAKQFIVGAVLGFNIQDESHQFILLNTNLAQQTAYILVKSTPQSATLKVGETKKFDVNGDNSTYELSVTLNSITLNSANVTLNEINEKMSTAEIIQQTSNIADTGKKDSSTATVSPQLPNISPKKSNLSTYIIVILVVLFLVAFVIYLKKQKRTNKINRSIKYRS